MRAIGNYDVHAREDAGRILQYPNLAQYDGNSFLTGMGWFVSGSTINIVVDLGQICSFIIQRIVPRPSKVVGHLDKSSENSHHIGNAA